MQWKYIHWRGLLFYCAIPTLQGNLNRDHVFQGGSRYKLSAQVVTGTMSVIVCYSGSMLYRGHNGRKRESFFTVIIQHSFWKVQFHSSKNEVAPLISSES